MKFPWQFERQNRKPSALAPWPAWLPESLLFITVRICAITWAYMSASDGTMRGPGTMSGPQGMVRVRRVQAGLTQEQLAELSGLSVRAISDIERGITTRPRRSSVALLEAALNRFAEDGDASSSDDAPHRDHGLRSVVPQQLPPPVPGFVGRARELNALTDLLSRTEADCGAVVISVIAGTAGVGKTALAVHWAHRAAERFPDGQLYVNLRAYDPDRPVPAADALGWFLRALGVAGPDVPPEPDERGALYRSLLAGRRMLVVLDNAGSAEQVRPLLPGTPACRALVTSRDSMAGLVARDGATRLDLDLLPLADAIALLRALIGRRVDADPAAAEVLADQCSRLPLALRVAAELATARPGMPLADLVGELADQRRRLDLLAADGDPRAGVRAVFSWSYQNLDAVAARTFRLLGLQPSADLDRYAVAALTGTAPRQAGPVLDLLVRAHLIQQAGPGRYGLHDLLSTYARDLAAAEDTEQQRHAALARLFDHYLHTAGAAMDLLFPAEAGRRPHIPPPAVPTVPVTDPATARAWLDAERVNLTAVAAHGSPRYTPRLAAIMSRYLDSGGHYPEAVAIHGHASRAARLSGDRAAEATSLTSLGLVHFRQGRYRQAASYLQQALALSRQTGNLTNQARALCNLALVEFQRACWPQGADHLQQALALHRAAGDRAGEVGVLCNLGLVDQRLGRFEQATGRLRQALAVSRQTGNRTGEGRALGHLGLVDLRQGRYPQAADHFEAALAVSRETGNRSSEAYNLANLGLARLAQGRFEQATAHHRAALELFREFGDRAGEAEALSGLGAILLATGRTGDARVHYDTALSLAGQIGDRDQQARAHDGLGQAFHAAGEPGRARLHWEQALALYAELGVPEAEEVLAQLSVV